MLQRLHRIFITLRIPLAIALVFGFFGAYSRFAVNNNIQNLQDSLSILDAATGVGQAEAALILVDQTLVNQMSQEKLNLKVIAATEFSRSSLATAKQDRPVTDAQVMLGEVAEQATASRPALLKTFDGISKTFGDVVQKTRLLPKQLLQEGTSSTFDHKMLEATIALEQGGKIKEAIQGYQRLLGQFPKYDKRDALMLRLGSAQVKLGLTDDAKKSFRTVISRSLDLNQITAARQLLASLENQSQLLERIKTLEADASKQTSAVAQQSSFLGIGNAYLQMRQYKKASTYFAKAHVIDPKSENGLTALFKDAWANKSLGDYTTAKERLEQVLEHAQDSEWSAAAYHQLAEIAKAQSNFDAALDWYDQIIHKTDNAAFQALTLAHAGTTALYDIEDATRSAFYLSELSEVYPASPYSNTQNRIQSLERAKGSAFVPANTTEPVTGTPIETTAEPEETKEQPTGTAGPLSLENQLKKDTPLVKILEKFLPVFVEVFIDRLTRYMETAEVNELSRRYTEEEFRTLVVARVQERFPGKVRNVQTKIQPDGFIGSGNIKFGILNIPIRARVAILVKNELPNVIIHEVKVSKLPIPKKLLKYLEEQVNSSINASESRLRIKEYTLHEGYAFISVELAS